jgi:hypothetical protein
MCHVTAESSVAGTFLVRFSKSTTGSFALAYKAATQVQHVVIQSGTRGCHADALDALRLLALPDGFKIREGADKYRVGLCACDVARHCCETRVRSRLCRFMT